ncbi:MAG: DUF3006 domain-containing protein [Eubacterium sp.]
MIYMLDRFEGDVAVLIDTDDQVQSVDKKGLPKNAKEGDYYNLTDGRYIINEEETEKARQITAELMKEVLIIPKRCN